MIKVIIVIALLFPVLVGAQSKGIQFGNYETWQDVLQDAKQKQKNIFIDAYATWCGPCKMMDKDVYTDSLVGVYVNDNYISVKIQFDQTKGDDAVVKNWYNDAISLAKTFQIEAYPTLLFISPEGKLLERTVGFQPVQDFVAIAKRANDPEESFSGLVKKFQQGNLLPDEVLKLAFTAKEMKQDSIALNIAREYKRLVIDKKNPEDLLSPAFVDFLTNFYVLFSYSDPIGKYLYKQPEKADSLFGRQYAAVFVNYLVYRDFIQPFITKDGKYVKQVPAWNKLEKSVAQQFDHKIAHRLILSSKASYYKYNKDWNKAIKYAIEQIDMRGIDTSFMGTLSLNSLAYDLIFMYGTEKSQLNKGLYYIQELLKKQPNNYYWLDTYANLLYKTGEKQRGIKEQEKAVLLARNNKDSETLIDLEKKLQLMKENLPTWAEQSNN